MRISDWSSDVCSSDLGYPYAVIHRADLHQVLLDVCRAQPLIELRNSAKVTAHTAGDDGVSVTLADGETIAGDSLIACDGLWSVFRADIVGAGKQRVSGHIAYRAVQIGRASCREKGCQSESI